MMTDVSTLLQIMNSYKDDKPAGGGKSTALITRDLLGGCRENCCTLESTELDLDLQVPTGWEKHLDLKSGKVYLQKCDSQNQQPNKQNESFQKLQNLNFSQSSKQSLSLFDDSSLDLKLATSPPRTLSSSPNYQSVCTLDKVKSALERAERETSKKRSVSNSSFHKSFSKSCSPVLSNSSSSVREMEAETETDYEEKSSPSFAAGCSSCLLYVLISKNNPKCPRCRMIVPYPVVVKKPRIDLNISM